MKEPIEYTAHGKKHAWTYINDYVAGKLPEHEVKALLSLCFMYPTAFLRGDK